MRTSAFTDDGRLLGRIDGDFADGRVALLVCPVCCGLDCGALSMELGLEPAIVAWRHFGWQDGFTDEPQPWLLPEQSFFFDRAAYESDLLSLRGHYVSIIKTTPARAGKPKRSTFAKAMKLFRGQ